MLVDSAADAHVCHPEFAKESPSKKSTGLTLRDVETLTSRLQASGKTFCAGETLEELICVHVGWRERLDHISPNRHSDDSSIVSAQE